MSDDQHSLGASHVTPIVLGPEVTIGTAAYGNVETTKMCLESLFRSVTGDYELILIDDFSPDGGQIQALFREAKKFHANTKLIFFGENKEYSGSVNALLSHAGGQWVFFISNDIFVTPFYLQNLLEAAKANPMTGILRGSSNFVDNGGLPSHNLKLSVPITDYDQLVSVGKELSQKLGHQIQTDPFLVGDAFLVTRPVLDQIGTFDPNFYGYFADPDFGVRARIAGFKPALVQGAFALHQQGANFSYLPQQQRDAKLSRRWMRVYENWARFKMKHGLSVDLPYQPETVTTLPWDQLAAVPFEKVKHYTAPGDYSHYIVS